MPRSELRSRVRLPGAAVDAMLAELQREGALSCTPDEIALTGHGGALRTAAASRLMQELSQGGLAPPRLSEAIARAGATGEHVRALARAGEIVVLSGDLALTGADYRRAREAVRDLIQGTGPVTVADVRDHLGTSRRHTLALLEHLDGDRVTRREGDRRTLVDQSVRQRSEARPTRP
jgi:selenocysteine-specific elongation factor